METLTVNVQLNEADRTLLENVSTMLASLSQEIVDLKKQVRTNTHYWNDMDKSVTRIERELQALKWKEEPESTAQSLLEIVHELNPKRADVVAKAKVDVEALKSTHYPTRDRYYAFKYYECDAEFIVNREKRTVVYLLRVRYRRSYGPRTVYVKGIAKCAPGDVFNESIGKAIALRRALGLPVPSEYLNAPAPEGVSVGDVVEYTYIGDKEPSRLLVVADGSPVSVGVRAALTSIAAKNGTVIDDSDREEYSNKEGATV
jgi:hypothetical protein